jgi:hypothetical protein
MQAYRAALEEDIRDVEAQARKAARIDPDVVSDLIREELRRWLG